MKAILFLLLSVTCLIACRDKAPTTSGFPLNGLPSITGKAEYLASPFVTAGDRVYMVGYQDGSFPDLGWHIAGEMGGVWDHPIKLLDGFTASITRKDSAQTFCLNKADKFVNYPIANLHEFIWKDESIIVERTQFVPDAIEGIVVNFKISNKSNEVKEFVFSFTGHTDLQPTWLGERTKMINGEDEITFDEKLSAFIAKDRNNSWYTAFGSNLTSEKSSSDQKLCVEPERKTSGKSGTLNYSITLSPGEETIIPVFIAGASDSETSLRATFESLRQNSQQQFRDKAARYETITNAGKLTIPDKDIEQMYQWLKYNTDWLVRNVPAEGTGLSAGLPDYPWWFGCDNTYALQGVLATGNHEVAKKTIELIYKISRRENNNGRIIHEVSTNGAVFNPGNVNETAQFISLLLYYYSWTGDAETVIKFIPDVKKGIQWLRDQDPDHNGYPNGNGLMEIHGLDKEMIDVAVYTQQALASASVLMRVTGDSVLAEEYQKSAEQLKAKINRDWWQPEFKSYGDFIGTPAEANRVVDAAIIRADTLQKPWAVAELRKTKQQLRKYPNKNQAHVVYHNWVVNTPMETGIADQEKAKAALESAKQYENPFGVFVTGIDRTEEEDTVVLKSRKKIFSYVGAVMTVPTGVQAVASARYGDPDGALTYIKKLNRSFSYALPGSMYEVSPDFGMITQAWNIYGVAVPIVQYFFGIQPRAYEQSISLSPQLPGDWNNVAIENVRIGNNSVSVSIQRNKDVTEYQIRQTQPDWTIYLDTQTAKKILVNGKETTPQKNIIQLTGAQVLVQVYH